MCVSTRPGSIDQLAIVGCHMIENTACNLLRHCTRRSSSPTPSSSSSAAYTDTPTSPNSPFDTSGGPSGNASDAASMERLEPWQYCKFLYDPAHLVKSVCRSVVLQSMTGFQRSLSLSLSLFSVHLSLFHSFFWSYVYHIYVVHVIRICKHT